MHYFVDSNIIFQHPFNSLIGVTTMSLFSNPSKAISRTIEAISRTEKSYNSHQNSVHGLRFNNLKMRINHKWQVHKKNIAKSLKQKR